MTGCTKLPREGSAIVATHPYGTLRCLQESGGRIEPSVASVGDSYDSALAETILGLYKTEVIHRRRPQRHLEAVEYASLEWVDWFNRRRLLEPIGNVPPAELGLAYHRQQNQLGLAA
jgi:putative transposase